MPHLKIYIHAVWATKNRNPYLNNKIRSMVLDHIHENARVKNIHIDHINGYFDHIHALLSMDADQTIAGIINQLKGESSFWINKQTWMETQFAWQNGYFAVSVGESQVKGIRKYIRNQEEHHRKKSFEEEYDELMRKYKF